MLKEQRFEVIDGKLTPNMSVLEWAERFGYATMETRESRGDYETILFIAAALTFLLAVSEASAQSRDTRCPNSGYGAVT
jgi:hypothetical protein